MADHNDDIVTFRQAPDEFCAEHRSAPWRRYRHALYRGFWLDQFRDGDGNSTLIMPDSMCSFGHGKREPWDRAMLTRLLGINRWVPEAVGRGRDDSQKIDKAYKAMAALPPEDYAQSWRQEFMEPMAILRDDLLAWQENHKDDLNVFPKQRGLTNADRRRGGKVTAERASSRTKGLRAVVQIIKKEIEARGQQFNHPRLVYWLKNNAATKFATTVPNCDDLKLEGDTLYFIDGTREKPETHNIKLTSLQRYTNRAKHHEAG